MREREHVIVLSGPDFRGSFFRPEAMGRFERSLPDALLNAARMRFFASSRRIGRPGLGIERATELWIGDIQRHEPTGGTQVTARLPILGDAAPTFFQQPALFDQPTLFGPEPTRETTALDLLGDAIRAVARQEADSDLFDRGMLRRLPMLRPEGVERMSFSGRDLLFSEPATVDADLERRARDLSEGTPEPYRTRVVGHLEGIFHDARAFVLKLRDGTGLRGIWTSDDVEPLRRGWGEDVLVEGMASFRPSGAPLVFEAETIRPAREEDRFWERPPRGVGPAPRPETPSSPAPAPAEGTWRRTWHRRPADASRPRSKPPLPTPEPNARREPPVAPTSRRCARTRPPDAETPYALKEHPPTPRRTQGTYPKYGWLHPKSGYIVSVPAALNVGLFGTATRSNTLLVIAMLGETHPAEIARVLEISLSQAQNAVASLERVGVVVSVREGVERRARLNPRYPLYEEVSALLAKAALQNVGLQERLATLRRRPRRTGKAL